MGERNEGKERIKCSSTTVQHIPVLMPLLMEELCRGTAEWILHPVVYHSVGPSTCHVHSPLIFPRKHRRWYSGVGGCARNQFDDQMRWMGHGVLVILQINPSTPQPQVPAIYLGQYNVNLLLVIPNTARMCKNRLFLKRPSNESKIKPDIHRIDE
ncbi:hypothetical protein VNO80_28730 [Phaseolus coccineus]|uniref:Uncharacterized protein n=1 Tax=Phaseolus coccineus TaxID=3886 RepID=A0AAN9QEA0_PHACN